MGIIFIYGLSVGVYKIFPYEALDSSLDIIIEEKSIEDKFSKFPSGLYKAYCSKCGNCHMPSDRYQLMKGSECCHVEFVPVDPDL